jgi:nucleotide-binding universal stress UspA family protein
VLVAWNASREATRAMHDALPILKNAERVVIFAFERHRDGKATDMDALVAHVANHGIKARVEGWTDTGDIDAVSALFASLDTDDIDLIVAGDYGHSRWLEGLFGGVSHDLITRSMQPRRSLSCRHLGPPQVLCYDRARPRARRATANEAVTTPSNTVPPLPAGRLSRPSDLSRLAFATTAELAPVDGLIGQSARLRRSRSAPKSIRRGSTFLSSAGHARGRQGHACRGGAQKFQSV